MRWARADSMAPWGWRSSKTCREKASKDSCSSSGTMWRREVRPWVRAFWETLSLPSGDLGPVDFWAFWRLAASLAGESSDLRFEICDWGAVETHRSGASLNG